MGSEPARGAAVVAGASGGIGAAVAERLAAGGWPLVLCGRRRERLDEVAEACRARGAPGCAVEPFDLRDPDVDERLAAVVAGAGPVGLVVHAAGASPRGGAAELTVEDWQQAVEVRLLGAVRLLAACRARFAPGGSMVVVTGEGGWLPSEHYALGALNAALTHFVKSAALELAADGVRCNAVSPGLTRTERTAARQATDGTAGAPGAPLGRLVEPAEIADAVAFLAGAAAVTGESISVSAGRSALRL